MSANPNKNPYYASVSKIRKTACELGADFFSFSALQTKYMILCSFEQIVSNLIKSIESYNLNVLANGADILADIQKETNSFQQKSNQESNSNQSLQEYQEFCISFQQYIQQTPEIKDVLKFINQNFYTIRQELDQLLENRMEFGLYSHPSVRIMNILFTNLKTELKRADSFNKKYQDIVTARIPDLFNEENDEQNDEENENKKVIFDNSNICLKTFIEAFLPTENEEEEEGPDE